MSLGILVFSWKAKSLFDRYKLCQTQRKERMNKLDKKIDLNLFSSSSLIKMSFELYEGSRIWRKTSLNRFLANKCPGGHELLRHTKLRLTKIKVMRVTKTCDESQESISTIYVKERYLILDT